MNKRTGARANVRAGGTLAGNTRRPRPADPQTARPEAAKAPEREAAKPATPQASAPLLTVTPRSQPAAVGRPATKFGHPGRASDVRGAVAAPPRGVTSAHGKEAAARLFGDYSYVKQDLIRIAILTVAALICLIAISFLLPLWLH